MKNKIAKLISNPESYMDSFLIGNSLGSPKNGYINEKARKKARLKRKKRK